jgi:hypothetical protein
VVIEGILDESRGFYQAQYDQLTARLLHIPRGSLRCVERGGARYWYLRRHLPGQGYKDVYIGPDGEPATECFVAFVREKKTRLEERAAVKKSLKALGVTRVEFQEKGYHRIFLELAEDFGRAGLWDEGLMLIGSWCFGVYVQAFGVPYFPLRTMDFDFGLRIPYRGDKADVDGLLQDLGFTAKIDPAYDKVDYVLPGVGIVEVFIDREQATREQREALKSDLSLRPAAVSNLKILTDNPVTVKIHGVHKAITLPCLPAFFVHRLVTAKFGEYRDPVLSPAKIRKDYKQAALVAVKVGSDKALMEELSRIVSALSEDLREKMHQGARAAAGFVKAPDLTQEDVSHIRRMAEGE